jgi:hypothetical protein
MALAYPLPSQCENLERGNGVAVRWWSYMNGTIPAFGPESALTISMCAVQCVELPTQNENIEPSPLALTARALVALWSCHQPRGGSSVDLHNPQGNLVFEAGTMRPDMRRRQRLGYRWRTPVAGLSWAPCR